MKRVDGRVKYTKAMIQQAFWALLRDTPVERMTVTALCEQADINRATFYRHYSDCYTVLEELETQMLAQLEKAVRGASPQDTFLKIATHIQDSSREYVLIASENGDRFFPQKILRLFYRQVKEQLKQQFPMLPEHQRAWVYSYAANGCAAVLDTWMQSGMRESPNEVAGFMSKLMGKTASSGRREA